VQSTAVAVQKKLNIRKRKEEADVFSLDLWPYAITLCYLITGTLFLWISAHLIVLLLSSPDLNLTFLLLPITSSHSHTSASDSTSTIGAI